MNRFKQVTVFIGTSLYLSSCALDMNVEPKSISSTSDISSTTTSNSTASTICDYQINEALLIAGGWRKQFDEDFNKGLSNWNIWYGGAYNYELQMYESSNLSLSNGILYIKAKKETVVGPTRPDLNDLSSFQYTSGRIESKTQFSAKASTPRVRIMARLKLPKGYGMWPAFWSYGDPWPTKGEIDIMEARGQEGTKYNTCYFYGKEAGVNLVYGTEGYINTVDDLSNCFHVFELIWTKNSLTYLLDGQIVDYKTDGYIPSIFGKSEKITLNLAVGGLFFQNLDPSLISPGTMAIDWVKVFTSN